MPTSKAHRALGNCDRMNEQTDFSTFSAKKLKKGDIHQKRNKGRKKRAFPKRAKKAKKGRALLGKGLSMHASDYHGKAKTILQ